MEENYPKIREYYEKGYKVIVGMETVVASLPTVKGGLELGSDRLREPLYGKSAECRGLIAAKWEIESSHGGACGLVYSDGSEAGNFRKLIKEIIHGTTDLGGSLVVIFQLSSCENRADLINSSLHTAKGDMVIIL